jgi:hypothetical protein
LGLRVDGLGFRVEGWGLRVEGWVLLRNASRVERVFCTKKRAVFTFMAEQISSVSTRMTSSTTLLHSSKVFSPTILTATPSAKVSTWIRV